MGIAYTVVGKAVGVQDLAFPSTSGFLIAGLRIDNYSGSWITVRYSSYQLYVPPYTIGWLTPIFPKSQSGPDIQYTPGPDPALYPSTTNGQPAVVTVYEDSVPPSPGVSYLNPFGGIPGPSLGSSCDDPLYVTLCGSPPSMSWQGLAMRQTASTTFSSFDTIPWDDVVADSDGIQSTVPFAFGGITQPIGTAGVVPTGMDGLWRMSLNQAVQNIDAYAAQAGIVKNDFDWQISDSLGDGFSFDLTAASPFGLQIASFVRPLVAGDVIWAFMLPTGGDIGAGLDATFLMEYLGPTP